MVKQLPNDVAAKMKAYAKAGRDAWQAGDVAQAELNFLKAWETIPEPKLEYDYAQSYVRGFVTFFRDTAQFAKAEEWFPTLREAYGGTRNDSVEFLIATVRFQAGKTSAAIAEFRYQYKKYGDRPFQGEDPRYLAALSSEEKRPQYTQQEVIPSRDGDKELSDALYSEIKVLSEVGDDLFDEEEYLEAITKWRQALEILPNPKSNWEASTWLYGSIGDAYFMLGDFVASRNSFFDALNGPASQDNPFLYFRIGQCELNLGGEKQAKEFFLKAYTLDGETIFLQEDGGDEYLKILRNAKLIP